MNDETLNDETFEQKEVLLVKDSFSEADLKALEKEEEPEPEMVEPVKPNRHERRKRAKLARRMAVKEKLEAEARKRGK